MHSDYEVTVPKGFETLTNAYYTAVSDEGVRFSFREPVQDRTRIKSMVFGGFMRCLYKEQKFDSDSERRFAIICENDPIVDKWFKPSQNHIKIYYGYNSTYYPDFVVESKTDKFIVEVKRESDMNTEVVQNKAAAVIKWCEHATKHELQHNGKPWTYLLISHNDVQENMTLEGLKARYTMK